MDEYISREALLAEIAADYGNWIVCNDTDESYRQGVKDNYSDTIRLINDIPAADVQPVDRWISVKDRLPEYDKIVLVWYSYDGIWGKTAGYGISWYHGKWNINELNQTGDNLEVLYWMYAPEPPKDGDAE